MRAGKRPAGFAPPSHFWPPQTGDSGGKKQQRADFGSSPNGIQSFYSSIRMRLAKLRVLNRTTPRLRLKECEFRFDQHRDNLLHRRLNEFQRDQQNGKTTTLAGLESE